MTDGQSDPTKDAQANDKSKIGASSPAPSPLKVPSSSWLMKLRNTLFHPVENSSIVTIFIVFVLGALVIAIGLGYPVSSSWVWLRYLLYTFGGGLVVTAILVSIAKTMNRIGKSTAVSRMPLWLSIPVFMAIIVVGFIIPWKLFYADQVLHVSDMHVLYMFGAIGLIFIVGAAFFFLMSRDKNQQLVQMMVISIAVTSFYAFGWPKDMTEPLYRKFSELCVILVLFLLSELAVKLNYDSTRIKDELAGHSRDTVKAIETATTNTLVAITNASVPIESAKGDINTALRILSDAQLKDTALQIKDVQNTLRTEFPVFTAVSKFPESQVKPEVLKVVTRWIESWAHLFTKIKNDSATFREAQIKCVGQVLSKYADDQIKNYEAKINLRLLDQNGLHTQPEEIPFPKIPATDETYAMMLEEIATSLNDAQVNNSFGPGKIVYVAFSNLLPAEWYNWRYQWGSFVFPGMERYKRAISNVARLPITPDFRRYIVVETDNSVRARAGYARNGSISDDSNGLGSYGIATSADLKCDFNDLYCLFFRDPSIPRDNISNLVYYSRSDMIRMVKGIVGYASEVDNRGLLAEKRTSRFSTPTRLDEIEKARVPLSVEADIYPIFSHNELVQMGIEKIENNWKLSHRLEVSGQAVDIHPLKDVFLETLHVNNHNCEVLSLVNQSDLEVFPDKRTDILLVGHTSADKMTWLLALSTGLQPGDNTMLVGVITEKRLLEHIAAIPRHFLGKNQLAPV